MHRYEGENYVLIQQVVRASLKTLHALVSSSDPHQFASTLPPSTSFLRLLVRPPPIAASTPVYSISEAVLLIELRAAHMVQGHAKGIRDGAEDGGADWRVGRAVAEAFVAKRVEEAAVQALNELEKKTATVVAALLRLVSGIAPNGTSLSEPILRSISSASLKLAWLISSRLNSSHAFVDRIHRVVCGRP